MTESIGTARLDIVVGTEGVDAGIGKVTAATRDMSKAAKDASASMEVNSKRQIASLEKQARTYGLARDELIRYRIETQTTGEQQKRLLGILDQQVAKLKQSGVAFGSSAKSAKELQFAMRGLPAQVTDIVTALGSGQRPLTVLLQQGGQLKDMFGGIVPAARALGGAVLGLVNPYTLAAAAIGAFALAEKSAADESDALNRAIILTGNFAKTSADGLRQMGERISEVTGATKSRAVDVVGQVAATGRFTAEQIEAVSKAAIEMQRAAGIAIEDTITQFVRLADDPVRAIETLDKSQHLLSESTKRQIQSLKDQGREAEAAALAITSVSDAVINRSNQVERHLSGWALLWKDVGTAASGAFDEIKRGLTDTDAGTKAAIGSTNALMTAFSANLGVIGTLYQRIFNIRSQIAKAQDGKADFGNVISGSDIVSADFAKHRGLPADFGLNVEPPKPDESPKTPRFRSSGGRSSAPRELPDFTKNAIDELQRQAEAEDRATQSFLDMQAALDGPLAQAEREHAKRVAELNQLAQQSPAAAAGLKDALEKEAQAHQKNVDAIKAEMDPLGQLLDDMKFELDTIGLSNTQRAVMIELRRNHIDVMSQEAQAALATANAFDTEAKAKQTSIDLMDDFRRGASDALADFVTGAKSAKDALKDFFNELAAQITHAISQNWMEKLFGQQGQSGGGSYGGLLQGLFGLFTGGSGGGEQWYANGGAFENGVQKFAYGGVVGSPTNFIMSGGRLGLMGEAGPEAILPLHRGPDGKLGVRMEAANDSRRYAPSVVNQTLVLQGRPDSRTPDQYAQAAARGQNRVASRNR